MLCPNNLFTCHHVIKWNRITNPDAIDIPCPQSYCLLPLSGQFAGWLSILSCQWNLGSVLYEPVTVTTAFETKLKKVNRRIIKGNSSGYFMQADRVWEVSPLFLNTQNICSGDAPNWYWKSIQYKSQPGHQLCWQVFHGFHQFFHVNYGPVLWTHPSSSLPAHHL